MSAARTAASLCSIRSPSADRTSYGRPGPPAMHPWSPLAHDRSDQQGAVVGDAVSLAPDAHGAGLGQGAVAGAEQHLAVERHLEFLVGRDDPQRMPLVGLDRCFLAGDLAALALVHTIETHRVVER